MIPVKQFSRSQLKNRFVYCVAVVAAAFTILSARIIHLQVIKGSEYRYQSENNRVRVERMPAPRGVIYDRNREILADTFAAFSALAIPSEIPEDRRQELFRKVSDILAMPVADIEKAVKATNLPKWRPRLIKRRLTRDEMAQLEVRRIDLPGFIVSPNPVRTYPHGELMGPALGYMGAITGEELELPQFENYDPADYVGKGGVEKTWEGRLRGQPGGVQVQVDVVGRKFGTLNSWPASPGENIVLTIDKAVQKAAEDAMGEEAGSVVAMEVGTGRILAMVSKPGFDPNIMARGVTSKEWAELLENPRHPLNNRPVQGTYAPGSTFKVMMALAGLESGAVTPSTMVNCSGGYAFGNRTFRCWKSSGHGGVNLQTAIEQSCDVYFYKLGLELGVDKIHDYAKEMGLGLVTGIELPGERSGLIPSTAWKKSARKQPWYQGETLSVSIGQGYVTATTLQLASMIASVADPQGRRMRPILVDKVENADGVAIEVAQPEVLGKLPFQPVNLALVREGLRGVVTRGTARKAAIPEWSVAGKTGTAQVVSMGAKETSAMSAARQWAQRDHALFVAYAPFDDPKIALAVILDHGGHGGSAAAPVAARVIKAYHDVLYPPPEEESPLGDESNPEFVGPPSPASGYYDQPPAEEEEAD